MTTADRPAGSSRTWRPYVVILLVSVLVIAAVVGIVAVASQMQAAEAQRQFEICMAASGYDASEDAILISGSDEDEVDAIFADLAEAAERCGQ